MNQRVSDLSSRPEWRFVVAGVVLEVIGGLALIESRWYDDLLQFVGLLFSACGLVGIIAGAVALGIGMGRGDDRMDSA